MALQERLIAAEELIEVNRRKLESYQRGKKSNRPRNEGDSISESERSQKGEIKRDVAIFEKNYGIKNRENWLNDLNTLFEGALKKYILGKQKVLAATNFLYIDYKGKWVIYKRNYPGDIRN